MRAIFGVLSLLVVVAIVGLLAKKQLRSISDIQVPVVPGGAASMNVRVNPDGNVQQQSQQIQQQFKAATEAAIQQPRAMPEDK